MLRKERTPWEKKPTYLWLCEEMSNDLKVEWYYLLLLYLRNIIFMYPISYGNIVCRSD